MYSTQSAQETARDAIQIFGGRGITKSGMGKFIEHVSIYISFICLEHCIDTMAQAYRTAPFDALLGGAEDVLGDLGVRQAMRAMPKNARL